MTDAAFFQCFGCVRTCLCRANTHEIAGKQKSSDLTPTIFEMFRKSEAALNDYIEIVIWLALFHQGAPFRNNASRHCFLDLRELARPEISANRSFAHAAQIA